MKLLFTTLLFLFPVFCFSQSNYKEAFVITNDNDTVYGLVDFRTDKVNLEVCRFRLTSDSAVQVYRPGEIKGFRFIEEGKFYVTRNIEIEGVPRMVFVEFLIEGEMNLYYYLDDRTDYYFFETEEGMIPARKKTTQFLQYNNLDEYEDNQYKGALAYVFRDVESLFGESRNAGFDRRTMMKFTKKYHDQVCTTGEECIVFENDYKKQFLKATVSLYAGLQYVDYTMASDVDELFFNTGTMSPAGGIQVLVVSPRLTKSVGIQLDVSASKTKVDSELTYKNRYCHYTMDAVNLMSTLCLKYIYHKGRLRPTAEAGVMFNKLLNNSSTFYSEIKSTIIEGEVITQNRTDVYMPQIPLAGFYCGAGFDFHFKESKSSALFFRAGYAQGSSGIYLVDRGYNFSGKATMKNPHIKIGYTF